MWKEDLHHKRRLTEQLSSHIKANEREPGFSQFISRGGLEYILWCWIRMGDVHVHMNS
jgi:hypothetical protein